MINHLADHLHLEALFGVIRIRVVVISPPVPAGAGITWLGLAHLNLRIKNNQIVSLRPRIIASIRHISHPNALYILVTSMKSHMNLRKVRIAQRKVQYPPCTTPFLRTPEECTQSLLEQHS